jgi:hypothetical protein
MSIDLRANCVARYKLDDCAITKTVLDSSGNGYHGTSVRNTSLMAIAGKVGGALSFNGTSDYIIADTRLTQLFAPTYRDSFSVSLLFKGYSVIMETSQSFIFRFSRLAQFSSFTRRQATKKTLLLHLLLYLQMVSKTGDI